MPGWLPYLSLAVTLFIGAGTLIFSRRQTHTEEGGDARSEALTLAEIRAERNNELQRVNDDLDARIKAVAEKSAHDQAVLNLKVADLAHKLERQREESEHAQNLLLTGFKAVLEKALRHLTAEPPEVSAAISYLRDKLAGNGM